MTASASEDVCKSQTFGEAGVVRTQRLAYGVQLQSDSETAHPTLNGVFAKERWKSDIGSWEEEHIKACYLFPDTEELSSRKGS